MMATLRTFRPAIKDRQHSFEVQMLTLGDCTFAGLLASLIDVSLKGRALPPFLLNPRQRLSESPRPQAGASGRSVAPATPRDSA